MGDLFRRNCHCCSIALLLLIAVVSATAQENPTSSDPCKFTWSLAIRLDSAYLRAQNLWRTTRPIPLSPLSFRVVRLRLPFAFVDASI
jgi:hypothetical protein